MTEPTGFGAVPTRKPGAATRNASLGANVIGALVVAFYLSLLGPKNPNLSVHWPSLVGLFVGYIALSGTAGSVFFAVVNRHLAAAVDVGAPIVGPDRHTMLATPFRSSAFSLCSWFIAAGIFGSYDGTVLHGAGTEVARVTLGVVLGGLTTAAVVYLLTQVTMRPVFALAFADEPPTASAGPTLAQRIVLIWILGTGLPVLAIALNFLGRSSIDFGALRTSVLVLVGLCVAAGLATTRLVARSIARPLALVREGMDGVRAGDVDTEVVVDDTTEIGLLESGFNEMVTGLRERARLADLLGRHVGVEVAQQALSRQAGLGGEQRDVSTLFIDVIGSTTLAATMSATEVVERLNAVFSAVVRTTVAEGGWVNKFEGDGALCVFGTPNDMADHPARALRVARALRQEMIGLGSRYPGLESGIGVSTGLVVAGNIGAEQRYEYTVIGDPVNEAARLTEEAKYRVGHVLASENTVARAGDEARHWIDEGEVMLRGRLVPTRVYTIAP